MPGRVDNASGNIQRKTEEGVLVKGLSAKGKMRVTLSCWAGTSTAGFEG